MRYLIFYIFLIFGIFNCTSWTEKEEFLSNLSPEQIERIRQKKFAIKYGYNSECLVLMSGLIPSRMEPCVVGDFNSGREMFESTKVKIDSEIDGFDYYIPGYGFNTFVDNTYYQNVVLYKTSYQRRDYYDSTGLYLDSKKVSSFYFGPRRVFPIPTYPNMTNSYRIGKPNRLSTGMFMD